MEIAKIGKVIPNTKGDLNDLCIDAFSKKKSDKPMIKEFKKPDFDV